MTPKHGQVWWTELMTSDAAAAGDFYQKMLGWSFDEMPMPDGVYRIAMVDGQPVCGLMNATPEMTPAGPDWISYFAVDDVDASIAGVAAAGGRVAREPFDIPGVGRIGFAIDPTGAMVGFGTPAAR